MESSTTNRRTMKTMIKRVTFTAVSPGDGHWHMEIRNKKGVWVHFGYAETDFDAHKQIDDAIRKYPELCYQE